MAITGRKLRKQVAIERQRGAGVNRINPVLLVDGLAYHQTPTTLTLLQEVVKSSRADDITKYVMNVSSLRDRHLRLCNRAFARKINRDASKKMKDADAPIPSLDR